MRHRQSGITYLAVLFLIAISAVAVAGQGAFSALDGQREREEELLFVGDQFRGAITRYYESTPGPVKRYPDSLNDMLLDRRFEPARRHLRQVYLDPMAADKAWGEVRAPEGGVMGVFSVSRARPLKQDNFTDRNRAFARKAHYAEWVFLYQGGQTRHAPAVMLSAHDSDEATPGLPRYAK